jgi:DNA-binding winged helix-turn-helix (wHTH) protein
LVPWDLCPFLKAFCDVPEGGGPGKRASVRFALSLDQTHVGRFLRTLADAGVEIELVEHDLPADDPEWPTIVLAPLDDRVESAPTSAPRVIQAGGLLLDLETRTTYRGGVRIVLGRQEFELLRVLAQSAGRVVSREALMAEVWPDTPVCVNTIEVNVSTLRRKLGDGARQLIETVRGRGYVLHPVQLSEPRLQAVIAQRELLLRQRESAVARREAIVLARRTADAERATRTQRRNGGEDRET